MTANGLFVLGLQASFALGFAVLGPLVAGRDRRERAHRHRRGYLPRGQRAVLDPAASAVAAARHRQRRRAPGGCRGPGDAVPAQGRPGLHQGPQQHLLGTRVPDHHLLAHRRPGGAGTSVRGQGAGSPAVRFLGAGAAPRHRPRHRHPASCICSAASWPASGSSRSASYPWASRCSSWALPRDWVCPAMACSRCAT